MTIATFPSGPYSTNTYTISCPKTRQVAIIDAAPDSTEQVATYVAANQLTVVGIWLTHSHWDHIADVSKMKQLFDVPVAIHGADAKNLQSPGNDRLRSLVKIEGVEPEVLLYEGQIVKVGELDFEVIHTPGHTPGGICFYNEANGILFSGDTLFRGTIGILNLPTGQPERMWDSLAKLAKLPPDTKVYPGHGEPTTIGRESWLSDAKRMFG